MDLSPTSRTADLRKLATDHIKALLRSCARTMDDSDLKACVMIAREDGWLTDEETGFFITYWGLRHA